VRKIYIDVVEVLYLSWGLWMKNWSLSNIWFGLSLKVTPLGRLFWLVLCVTLSWVL